jgi:hypothetical protein
MMFPSFLDANTRPDWILALRRYLLFSLLGHFVWEAAHTQLYTISMQGNWSEIAFAVVHCTGGDLLIATSTVLLALFLVGDANWPHARARGVIACAIVLGVGYTAFSEWLDISVREAWAYREIMPLVPVLGVGLTPFLQWIVVPFFAYWLAVRGRPRNNDSAEIAHG